MGLSKKLSDFTSEEAIAYSKIKSARYRTKNMEKILLKQKEEYYKNPEKVKKKTKEYYLRNKKEINRKKVEKCKQRKSIDPEYRIRQNLRSRYTSIVRRGGTTKIHSLVLDSNSVRQHLESMFKPDMSWENYGTLWTVDHYIPCSAFDLRIKEHVEFCFSLQNTRPMYRDENIRKRDKIPENALIPFQLKTAVNSYP